MRSRVGIVFAGLVLAACAHVAAPRPARAQELSRWISDLDSPRPSVYRIAAAYVAHAGPVALDSLAARLPGADATMRAHVKFAVGVMLLTSVTPDQVLAHKDLRLLANSELDAAQRHAAALCASHEYETDIGAPSDSTMRHHDELLALQGWAVPAAVSLTQCKSASGRVFGMHLLVELKAGAQAAALLALTRDSTVVIAGEEEPQERTTIAELANRFAHGFPFSNHGAVLEGTVPRTVPGEAEEYLNAVARQDAVAGPEYVLDNRTREEAKTLTAHTWDEYWQRARSLLEVMWDPTGSPDAPAKKESPR